MDMDAWTDRQLGKLHEPQWTPALSLNHHIDPFYANGHPSYGFGNIYGKTAMLASVNTFTLAIGKVYSNKVKKIQVNSQL